MKNTANYNLKKPELTDPADITALNTNWDIIDSALATGNTNAFVVIPSGTEPGIRKDGILYFKTTNTMELVEAANYRVVLEE